MKLGERQPTVRDLLAVHAPDAPSWFQPAMRPRPEIPDVPEGLPLEQRDVAVSYRHAADAEIAVPSLRAWGESIRAARRDLESWEDERERQRLAQWPWYYADLVLEAGEPG